MVYFNNCQVSDNSGRHAGRQAVTLLNSYVWPVPCQTMRLSYKCSKKMSSPVLLHHMRLMLSCFLEFPHCGISMPLLGGHDIADSAWVLAWHVFSDEIMAVGV